MNLFETNPEIFANGKFRIRQKTGNTLDLIGVANKQYFPEQRCLLCYNLSGQIIERDMDECTLIARPIEDMTDEEVFYVVSDQKNGEKWNKDISEKFRRNIINHANSKILHFQEASRMIEHGIYPGPQSDFETDKLEMAES